MQISDPDSHILHVFCQILRHSFRKSRDQNLVSPVRFFVYLTDQIINLTLDRANLDLRIEKTCRTDDLLCTQKLMLRFILSRCCRDKQNLIQFIFKFIKTQRTVILCRRQTEAIIHQCLLAALITGIHSSDLRNGLMGLIYNKKKVVFKVVHQGIRRLSRLKPGKVSGIILNTGTKTCFLHHFYIEIRSLGNSLCLDQFIFTFKIGNLFLHFFQDRIRCLLDFFLRHNIMGCRKNRRMLQFISYFACQYINFCDTVDLISEKFHADRTV